MTELDMEHVYPPQRDGGAAAEPPPAPLWTTAELLNANHALQARVGVLEAQLAAIPLEDIRKMLSYLRLSPQRGLADAANSMQRVQQWLDTHGHEVHS